MTETDQLIRWAKGRGWTVARTARGHLRLTHPRAERPIFAAGTAGDVRSYRNTRSRRALAPRLPHDEDATADA